MFSTLEELRASRVRALLYRTDRDMNIFHLGRLVHDLALDHGQDPTMLGLSVHITETAWAVQASQETDIPWPRGTGMLSYPYVRDGRTVAETFPEALERATFRTCRCVVRTGPLQRRRRVCGQPATHTDQWHHDDYCAEHAEGHPDLLPLPAGVTASTTTRQQARRATEREEKHAHRVAVRAQQQAERRLYQAVYAKTAELKHGRNGRYHPYIVVHDVQDAQGTAVCARALLPVTKALATAPLQSGDLFTFEARHIHDAWATDEFHGAGHVIPIVP
jgi:hypothetical protein